MNAVAYKIMEENKKKIIRGLVERISESRKKEIMSEADTTIEEIKALHATLKKNEEIKQNETQEALAVALKNYSGKIYYGRLDH